MKRILFALALTLSLTAQGAWIDANGKTIQDTESMRSDGDFGAQLVLTPDDKQFRKIWNSTTGTPNLESADTVHPGESIAAMLIFHGCTPGPSGACDVVSEFFLETPDGSKTPGGSGPVWSSVPPKKAELQLGLASMAVGFDGTDPVGEYKVNAKITDKNTGRSLSLVARFKVKK